jgi:GNAT superfamily N-acetyltransferase
MEITIQPIDFNDKKRVKKFITFPWKIYEDDPNWVPPLIIDKLDFLNQKKNPFFLHSSAQLFMAFRGNEPVGRISAQVNNQHLQVHKDDTGFFGFFECVNDREVASALFETAGEWLKERGMQTMRGPASFSVSDEIGLLVEGLGRPPKVLMTYNPEYYISLIEDYGFSKIQDLYAYILFAQDGMSGLVKRMVKSAMKDPNLVIRNPTKKTIKQDMEMIKIIYKEAWSENWGAVPLTPEEFEHTAKEISLFYDPDITFIAEYKGEPAGVSIVLPDLNQALKHANGRLFPFGLLKILFYRRKIKEIRMPIMGVREAYRNRGIDAIFYNETYNSAVAKGIRSCELSWVLESNTTLNRILKKLGAKRDKTYRLYDYPLT